MVLCDNTKPNNKPAMFGFDKLASLSGINVIFVGFENVFWVCMCLCYTILFVSRKLKKILKSSL